MKTDLVGLTLSLLCAVHCLAFPVALSVMPVLGNSAVFSHTTEYLLMAAGFAFGGYVFVHDWQHHRVLLPLILFFSGALVMVIREAGLFTLPEMELTLIGSALSVAAFAVNWKHRKECRH